TNTVTGAKVHTAVEAAKESVEADGADAGLTVTEEQVAGKGTKFKVKVKDSGITTAKLADDAVTLAKLNDDVKGVIEGGAKTGVAQVKAGDAGKLATVDTVVAAMNKTGFNVQVKDGTKEFVKSGDTVKFVDGVGTTVSGTKDGGIKFDVAKSGFTTDTSTGDVSAETAGNTFATAADVATELNK
ncbi:hypothetical protein, partial [Phocoenobacter skyensis]